MVILENNAKEKKMMLTEEKKKTYGVLIIRKDLEHIAVLETADFQAAHATWKELNDKWITSIKENVPFILESPVVTSFDPGLIKEITVRPEMDNAQQRGGVNNPYERQMRREGLGNAMKYALGTDILDGGYK